MKGIAMKRQQGAAIVEFAMILPFLLVLTFTVTEMGRAFYQYNVLVKSVREAARYLTTRTPRDATVIANAKNIILYGNPSGSGSTVLTGLTSSNVPDPVWSSTSAFPVMNTVTVSVTNYRFTPLANSVFGFNFSNIVFSPIKATMRSPT